MADKDDSNDKKKKKSIIASLDLKNYKAKYTDSYGLGKPNEVDLDNFLIAEPDTKETQEIKETHKDKAQNPKSSFKKVENTINSINVASNAASTVNSTKSDNVTVDSKPKPIEQVKTVSANQSARAVASSQPVRDNDFERRVNAEADNDFYDDKPAQQIGDTFRSKAIDRRPTVENSSESQSFGDVNEVKNNRKLNIREPIKVNVRHEIMDRSEYTEVSSTEQKPIRRTETYGIVISAVALLYGILTKDKALVFLSVSLLLFLTRPVIAAPFGKYSQAVQNAIKGFSIALFIGSIFFIFF